MKKALVEKKYLATFILITSLFFMWGFAHAILDVLNKHFQEVLEMTKTRSALVQVMLYTGYFTMAIPAGLFISRRGYRAGVIVGLLLYGIGSLLFIPGEWLMSFEFFLFSLFVIGCGLTFLETSANPYVTELGARQTAAARLNMAQSFNGLGAMCAPIVGGWLIFRDNASVALPYMGLGIFVLLAAVVFTRVRLPEIHEDDSAAGSAEKARNASLARNFAFIFGVFALFCYEISEISINSFFINYATDGNWFDKPTATTLLSLGGLMLFMVGLARDEPREGGGGACGVRYGDSGDHYNSCGRLRRAVDGRVDCRLFLRVYNVSYDIRPVAARLGREDQKGIVVSDDDACGWRCGAVAYGMDGRRTWNGAVVCRAVGRIRCGLDLFYIYT